MTCFPDETEIPFVLGLLNSNFAKFVVSALNPTISFQVGDIERLPVPSVDGTSVKELVMESVRLAKAASVESEMAYDFVSPARCLQDLSVRSTRLGTLGEEVDAQITRLYSLSDVDVDAMNRELRAAIVAQEAETDNEDEDSADDDDGQSTLSSIDLAANWLSYAIGIVLGRFEIGVGGGLGDGDFSPNVVDEIRTLVDADGVMVSDMGHPQDVVKRALGCLELMLGRDAAHETIHTATDGEGDAEDLLRHWFDRQFWKYHYKLYRKRPVYWPLQPPKKKFTVWVFHERFTKDTLFKIRTDFVEPKVRWLESHIRELKDKAKSTTGRESRSAEKEASQLADVLDDVQEFAQRLNRIVQLSYMPHIDDGVLLNAAPLWELLPSWPETKKAWQELEAGKYDWAQQAMEYWPDRVKEACQTNKSFAIAHGLA